MKSFLWIQKDRKCRPDNQSTVNDAITEDNRLYPDFSLIWDNFIRPLEGKLFLIQEDQTEYLKLII